MKIIIAPDSFKASLSAIDAARAMTEGITRAAPDATCVMLPLADGGDGTVETLLRGITSVSIEEQDGHEHSDASGARLRSIRVTDPLGRDTLASYGLMADGHTAVIEMASASGLQYVDS